MDSNNRVAGRRRMLKQGKVILTDWTVLDCIVRDISETGARLAFGGPTSLPKEVRLLVVSSNEMFPGEVAWQRGLNAGVHLPARRDPLRRGSYSGRRRKRNICSADAFSCPPTRSVAMAKDLRSQMTPLAEDFDVGDDSDLPGFDQPYTLDDVDAVLSSASASIEERREVLRRMLNDLQARRGMDETNEYGDLIEGVRGALATLDEPVDGTGAPGALAFDTDDSALAPDEIMERAEDEEARGREEG